LGSHVNQVVRMQFTLYGLQLLNVRHESAVNVYAPDEPNASWPVHKINGTSHSD